MKKSKMKLLSMVFAMVLCMSMTSITAFAGGTETQPTPEEETSLASAETYSLTPEGNLTLVDDVETNSTEDKQFITMQSKNGNYFYLVIDRSGDTDNVYFLNLVDEADLLALIEEPPTEEVPPVEQTVTTEPTPSEPPTTAPDEVAETKTNNSVMLALVGVVILIGGGVFYYFKFVKPKKETSKPTTNLEDYEFEDEEQEDDEYGFDFDNATEEELEEELE